MSIRFGCDSCGQHLEADQGVVGQVVDCTNCGKKLTVPEASTLPPKTEAPPKVIQFQCDKCGQNLAFDKGCAGLVAECPQCRQYVRVPGGETTSATSAFTCPNCQREIRSFNLFPRVDMACPFCGQRHLEPLVAQLPPQNPSDLPKSGTLTRWASIVRSRLAWNAQHFPKSETCQLRLGRHTFSIPERTYRLLWITEENVPVVGPLPAISFHMGADASDGVQFQIGMARPTEPSLISRAWTVEKPANLQAVESPDYYPSYGRLTPEQRWVFLTWLGDVTKPVNLGYVYVYYYGLERHLLLGDFQLAAEEMMLLREHHAVSYSDCALISACVLRRDAATLARFCDLLNITPCDEIALHAFAFLGRNLSATDLMSMAHAVGFNNQRYIKTQKEMFAQALEAILISRFDKPTCPILDKYNWNSLGKATRYAVTAFANYSFPGDIRSPSIPHFFQNEDFKAEVRELLERAHEKTKEALKESRRKKQN